MSESPHPLPQPLARRAAGRFLAGGSWARLVRHLARLKHHLYAAGLLALHSRHVAIMKVQVRTADRTTGYLDDRITGALDFGVRDLVAANISRSVPTQSLHRTVHRE